MLEGALIWMILLRNMAMLHRRVWLTVLLCTEIWSGRLFGVLKEPIELTDGIMQVIKKLDGMILSGKDIAIMLGIRRGIWDILSGVLIKSQNRRVGKYEFEGKFYSLNDLAIIERRIGERLALAGTTQQQIGELVKRRQCVKKCLEQAKKDFIQTAVPFLDQANQFKEFILPILNEWAQKRGRTDSLLLKWSKTNRGEIEIFNSEINDCQVLVKFSEDLDDFLAVFIHNCPHAYEQFKQKYLVK